MDESRKEIELIGRSNEHRKQSTQLGECRVGIVAPDLAHAGIYVRARERQERAREYKPDPVQRAAS